MSMENLKKLREATGIGMLECQKALKASNGDYEGAIKLLREKGKAIANKKADRSTGESLIGYAIGENAITVIEVSCETDFVSRGDKFQDLIKNLIKAAQEFKNNGIEKFLEFNYNGQAIKDILAEQMATLGENIIIKKIFYQESPVENIITYMHNTTVNNRFIGKILTIVFCDNVNEQSKEVITKIAMHIAAMKPTYLSRLDVPADKLNDEKEIYRAQTKDLDKPENVLEKIISGKIEKYYNENVLLEQELAIDPQVKISKLLGETDNKLKITSYQYFKASE